MATFTATGVSTPFLHTVTGEAPYTISGTFVGTVVVEHAHANDANGGWTTKTMGGAITGPQSGQVSVTAGMLTRLRCTRYVSGTITYSLTPSTALVSRAFNSSSGVLQVS